MLSYRVSYPDTANFRMSSSQSISACTTYLVLFEAYAEPAEADLKSSTVYSDFFTITQRQIIKLDITYDVDFNMTIGDQRDTFITAFQVKFRSSYPQVEIINVTLTEGSIIVGVTVTAVNPCSTTILSYRTLHRKL